MHPWVQVLQSKSSYPARTNSTYTMGISVISSNSIVPYIENITKCVLI